MFRYFNALFALASVAALAWVLSLPTKTECVAAGRVVDPTGRHCDGPASYQQLQEHAFFHSREVIVGAVLLWVIAYLIHRRLARRANPVVPPSRQDRRS